MNPHKRILIVSSAFNFTNKPIGIRVIKYKEFFSKYADIETYGHPISVEKVELFKIHLFYKAFILFAKILEILKVETLIIKIRFVFNVKLLNKKYDSIIINTRPFSFYYLSHFFKHVLPNSKICLDMSDPLVINVNFNKMPLLRKRQLEYIEHNLLKYIDVLVVLNEEIAEYYSQFIMRENIYIIPQGVNEIVIDSINSSDSHYLKMIYAGAFYKKIREPYELYKAVNNSNIKLDIYGNIASCFYPPNPKNIELKGVINQNSIFDAYSKYDIIVFLDNISQYQIPGKLIEILITQKPILFITNNNSPAANFAKNYCGIFFTKNNSNEIINKIQEIKLNINSNRYNRDLSNYTWNSVFKKLYFILE